MSKEKQPMGLLFDSVAYYQPEDIQLLVDNLSYEQSLFMISQALEYAHKNGLYSLQESELISKSLRGLVLPKEQ
jgi:hypothetical protein